MAEQIPRTPHPELSPFDEARARLLGLAQDKLQGKAPKPVAAPHSAMVTEVMRQAYWRLRPQQARWEDQNRAVRESATVAGDHSWLVREEVAESVESDVVDSRITIIGYELTPRRDGTKPRPKAIWHYELRSGDEGLYRYPRSTELVATNGAPEVMEETTAIPAIQAMSELIAAAEGVNVADPRLIVTPHHIGWHRHDGSGQGV